MKFYCQKNPTCITIYISKTRLSVWVCVLLFSLLLLVVFAVIVSFPLSFLIRIQSAVVLYCKWPAVQKCYFRLFRVFFHSKFIQLEKNPSLIQWTPNEWRIDYYKLLLLQQQCNRTVPLELNSDIDEPKTWTQTFEWTSEKSQISMMKNLTRIIFFLVELS